MTGFGGWTVGEQQYAERIKSGETLVGQAVRDIILREFAGMRKNQITPEMQALHDELVDAMKKLPSASVFMARKVVNVPAVSVVVGTVTTEIPVNWDPPLANAGYGVYPAVLTSAAGLFGKVTAQPKLGSNTKTSTTIVTTTTAVLGSTAVQLDVLALGTT